MRLKFKSLFQLKSLTVMGQEVQTEAATTQTIDITNLAKGTFVAGEYYKRCLHCESCQRFKNLTYFKISSPSEFTGLFAFLDKVVLFAANLI